jgi:8-oxo-dGTP pyrophosphatase MutT (NUDIX family)
MQKKLYEMIKNYSTNIEHERSDKQEMLYFIKHNTNVLNRNNSVGHFTSSSWIVNKEHTKVLMVFHNIYKSFSWTGGHNDGDVDFLEVAKKEAREETGIKNLNILYDGIFSLESLTVDGHIKNGKYVSSHLHFNLTYLFEADENESLYIKKDENSDVRWIAIKDLELEVNERWMKDWVYFKLVKKLNDLDKQ